MDLLGAQSWKPPEMKRRLKEERRQRGTCCSGFTFFCGQVQAAVGHVDGLSSRAETPELSENLTWSTTWSRTHRRGARAAQSVLRKQAGHGAATRPADLRREAGPEEGSLQQVVQAAVGPVVVSRRNLEQVCRTKGQRSQESEHTHTHTHTLTTHQVVQLHVGEGFHRGSGEELGSVAQEHGLTGERRCSQLLTRAQPPPCSRACSQHRCRNRGFPQSRRSEIRVTCRHKRPHLKSTCPGARTCSGARTCLALLLLPLKEPSGVHQDAHVLDAPTVGKVEPLGQVGLQVGFDLLPRLPTLQEQSRVRARPGLSPGATLQHPPSCWRPVRLGPLSKETDVKPGFLKEVPRA